MDTTGIVTSKKLQILPDQEDGRCVKCIDTIAKGEVLVQLPEASAVSVDMSETANPGPDLAPLADWWSRHTRSSIRLAAALVFQREKFGPYLDMLYPMENIYAPWLWEDQDLKFLPDGLAASAAARKKALESACKDLKAGRAFPLPLFLSRLVFCIASRVVFGLKASPKLETLLLAHNRSMLRETLRDSRDAYEMHMMHTPASSLDKGHALLHKLDKTCPERKPITTCHDTSCTASMPLYTNGQCGTNRQGLLQPVNPHIVGGLVSGHEFRHRPRGRPSDHGHHNESNEFTKNGRYSQAAVPYPVACRSAASPFGFEQGQDC